MSFTQAEREAKAKLFASASQIRLTIIPNPDYGEMYHDHVISVPTELAKVVAMIRGEIAEPSDEWCNAFLKGRGEWIEPYDPPTECGVQVECEITQEWADELNAEARAYIRKGFAAALTAAQ